MALRRLTNQFANKLVNKRMFSDSVGKRTFSNSVASTPHRKYTMEFYKLIVLGTGTVGGIIGAISGCMYGFERRYNRHNDPIGKVFDVCLWTTWGCVYGTGCGMMYGIASPLFLLHYCLLTH